MLPTVPPLTGDAARRWARSGVPRWVPRAFLTLAWIAALTLAVIGDTAECSADDPTV